MREEEEERGWSLPGGGEGKKGGKGGGGGKGAEFVFVQLPKRLPHLADTTTTTSSSSPSSPTPLPPITVKLEGGGVAPPPTHPPTLEGGGGRGGGGGGRTNPLATMGSGYLGKICVHKSGRMTFHAGRWVGGWVGECGGCGGCGGWALAAFSSFSSSLFLTKSSTHNPPTHPPYPLHDRRLGGVRSPAGPALLLCTRGTSFPIHPPTHPPTLGNQPLAWPLHLNVFPFPTHAPR